MKFDVRRGLAVGCLLGAAAGAIVALSDFGALWLWLPFWSERLVLLLRLCGSLVPAGALAGAALGAAAPAWEARLEARTERARTWLRPAPQVLLVAGPLALVAWLLFTGGRMSRLPMRGLLVPGAALALIAGTWVALALAIALVRRARSGPRWVGLAVGVALIAASLGAQKIDQRFLPNLYDYLHAGLSVVAWLLAGAGLAAGAPHAAWLSRAEARTGRSVSVVAGALAFALALHVVTLPRSPNVRVALLDPRAAASRSLMLALGPVVAAADARRHGQGHGHARDAERRHRLAGLAGLPETPGAHVLLITVDALRADHLGAYGYARGVSPTLDALAARSVLFEHAYSAAPHSSYSLSSTMTSEYLHETLDLDQPLPTVTLPRVLGDAGYRTAAFFTLGIFHTEGERLTRFRDDAFGFDVHDHTDLEAEPLTDRVLAEMDRVVHDGEPQTFFWAHYFDVHEPYEDTSLGTSDVDRYDGELRKADRAIARLLREMDAKLEAPVVVIVTSDHGEEFRDHGGVYHGSTLFEEQIHVPLFIRAPGVAPRRVEAPVQSIDLAPTIAGLVGVDAPDSWRGDDLRALMTGRVDDVGPAFAAVLSKRMVVEWPYKLIADLRFGTYELYDLHADAHERLNLAGQDAARRDRMRDDVYAWLDGLAEPPGTPGAADPRRLALDRGRLGDRRAEDDLGRLVLDASAPEDMRREAARILGRLADTRMAPTLAEGECDRDRLVAADCAIALGRMYDPRGREKLRELVHSEDPDIRMRAAVSLGRLRDRAAVPALIEALTHAETAYDREEAVRWLGRLRDPAAVEPLLASIPEFRTRYLVVVALGMIGDERAFAPMADMLTWEHRSNIRDNLVQGLGQLGDPRAIPLLVDVAAGEPDMRTATESLIRLGALSRGAVGGVDALPGAGQGLARCQAGPLVHDWDYQYRTTCDATSARTTLRLSVPPPVVHAESVVVALSVKRADATGPATLHAKIGDAMLADARVDGQWTELRWTLPAGTLAGPRTDAVIWSDDGAVRLRFDQLLLVPRPARVASAP